MTIVHLEAHGTAVIVDASGPGLPCVLHWGAPLGIRLGDGDALRAALARQTVPATLDAPWHVSLSPQEADAWSGRPGLQLRQGGVLLRPRWRLEPLSLEEATLDDASSGSETHRAGQPSNRCAFRAIDDAAGLELTIAIAILPGGVVSMDQRLRRTGMPDAGPIEVDWLESILPVPATTDRLLTFDGRWTREKRPVVTAMPAGSTVRQSRRGRSGRS